MKKWLIKHTQKHGKNIEYFNKTTEINQKNETNLKNIHKTMANDRSKHEQSMKTDETT